VTDWDAFRAEFPVLERVAYLNAGSDGPIPRRAAEAAAARIDRELARGRAGSEHWGSLEEMAAALRGRVAALMGCDPAELALTSSTTDGVNSVIRALALGPGDQVLTSDEEHPGVLAPLAAASRERGFEVRFAPLGRIADGIGPRTALVACSHVSWVGGRVVDTAALRAAQVPVLLDGAQGLGAIPVDVRELDCDFYAASGQKWLCGPDGSGYLYVRRERASELAAPWPSYFSLAQPERAFGLPWHAGARRFDLLRSGPSLAWSLAALDVLEVPSLAALHERAVSLAERLADSLAAHGIELAPRGRSTLVSWRSGDAGAAVARHAEQGVVVRDLPGRRLVRASVGAWTSEEELDRLVALAG
jgi:selenocysteine lyase/cysteine desulfurase